jgi:hypothetical protein
VGIAIVVLGGAVWTLGAWQARRRSPAGQPRRVARRRDLLPVAAATTAVGVAAFALGLLFPG